MGSTSTPLVSHANQPKGLPSSSTETATRTLLPDRPQHATRNRRSCAGHRSLEAGSQPARRRCTRPLGRPLPDRRPRGCCNPRLGAESLLADPAHFVAAFFAHPDSRPALVSLEVEVAGWATRGQEPSPLSEHPLTVGVHPHRCDIERIPLEVVVRVGAVFVLGFCGSGHVCRIFPNSPARTIRSASSGVRVVTLAGGDCHLPYYLAVERLRDCDMSPQRRVYTDDEAAFEGVPFGESCCAVNLP